ncbi:MAG: sigma factor, partial [Chloroflexota bacterium]
MTQSQDDTLIWIQRAQNGDQNAYAQLYNHYAAGIYRLCYGIVLNKQDAEDVVQESFVYAFKNLRILESRCAIININTQP